MTIESPLSLHPFTFWLVAWECEMRRYGYKPRPLDYANAISFFNAGCNPKEYAHAELPWDFTESES